MCTRRTGEQVKCHQHSSMSAGIEGDRAVSLVGHHWRLCTEQNVNVLPKVKTQTNVILGH